MLVSILLIYVLMRSCGTVSVITKVTLKLHFRLFVFIPFANARSAINAPVQHQKPTRLVAMPASKRLLDICGSAFGLVVLSPLFVVIALAVHMSSTGPIIFTQTRLGHGGKRIRVHKFRTMPWHHCDVAGIRQVAKNDVRVTMLGRFLRWSSFDELPQLFNVLKGELSLVGPRCHVPNMLAAGLPYDELVPQYNLRLTVVPGMTGLAQIRGFRGPTTNANLAKNRIFSDIEYIQNWSIGLDVSIIAKTLLLPMSGLSTLARKVRDA